MHAAAPIRRAPRLSHDGADMPARVAPISFFELDVRWLKRQGAPSSGRRLEVWQTVNGRFCEQVTVCGGDSAVEVISSGRRECVLTYRRAVKT